MNVVLAGEESAGVQALQTLLDTSHRLVAVLTSEEREGRSPALWRAAVAAGVETWPGSAVRTPALADRLREHAIDLLINVHSLHIICPDVLAAPAIGCFNLHPSALPRYAGLNSVSWALFRGERQHGVTLHWMDPGIDTGAIAYQALFSVAEDDTPVSLTSTCARLGSDLLLELVDAAGRGDEIPRRPMDASQWEYFGREVPFDGCIEWHRGAGELAAFVRACDYGPFPSPWGSPRASLKGEPLEILAARASSEACDVAPGTVGEPLDDGVPIACGEGWLVVSRARLAGRRVRVRETLLAGGRVRDGGLAEPDGAPG